MIDVLTPCCIDDVYCQEAERRNISLNNTICYVHVACSVNKEDKPELVWWGVLSVLDYPLFLCFLILFFFQPAARKGADKSGPGAGFTVLSEKTLFLGQKVSIQEKRSFFKFKD